MNAGKVGRIRTKLNNFGACITKAIWRSRKPMMTSSHESALLALCEGNPPVTQTASNHGNAIVHWGDDH